MDLTDHFSYISSIKILFRLKDINENPSYPLLERLSYLFYPIPMAGLKSAATFPFDTAVSVSRCATLVEKNTWSPSVITCDNSYNIENSNGTYIEDL